LMGQGFSTPRSPPSSSAAVIWREMDFNEE
jgi:hypothetical protein